MQAQPNAFFQLIPMILVFGIFYFLIIRPERKKQAEHRETLKGLKRNDEVITSAGIHGVVENVKERTVVLRIDVVCRVEFEKDAVTTVTKKSE